MLAAMLRTGNMGIRRSSFTGPTPGRGISRQSSNAGIGVRKTSDVRVSDPTVMIQADAARPSLSCARVTTDLGIGSDVEHVLVEGVAMVDVSSLDAGETVEREVLDGEAGGDGAVGE